MARARAKPKGDAPAPEPDEPQEVRRPSSKERERARAVGALIEQGVHEVPLLAEKTGSTEDEVVKALDEFVPKGGRVHFRGPGRGGPWV